MHIERLATSALFASQPDEALDQLESLLTLPYMISPGWLRLDPSLEPLRDNPRFAQLATQAPGRQPLPAPADGAPQYPRPGSHE